MYLPLCKIDVVLHLTFDFENNHNNIHITRKRETSYQKIDGWIFHALYGIIDIIIPVVIYYIIRIEIFANY